jgi:hypothetical protein
MLAAILAAQLQAMSLAQVQPMIASCTDGTRVACTLSGCAHAYKDCIGSTWGPCECTDCADGDVASCSLANCALAQQTCSAGNWTACACVIQTCSDGNSCTTDTLSGSACTHTLLPAGSACTDANACTTNDRCDAMGHCVGTPVSVDDSKPCTLDRCDPATGAITHTVVANAADCSSGTYFCYDKYGNVTRKVVCVTGQPCDTACP